MIQGAAVLTPETAEVLERVTGVPAVLWNTLEAAWRTQAVREGETYDGALAWSEGKGLRQGFELILDELV